MLTELRVRDLGVIEDLSLSFTDGMTVLTGETGAGKTLVVEALQLVLGGRADPSIVRAGAAEAVVEARFVVDTPGGETETVVARAVPAAGRSRSWIDGRMATVGALADAVSELVEIHGQHAHQSLVTPAAQRAVLDAYAGTDLGAVHDLRARLRAVAAAEAALGGDAPSRAREADVLRYQVAEIAAAQLSDPDEDDDLRQQEVRLADAGAHRESAARAAELLEPASGAGEGGVLDRLAEAAALLGGREAVRRVPGADRDVGHRPGRRGPRPARRGGELGGRSGSAGSGAGTPPPPVRPASQVRGRPPRR